METPESERKNRLIAFVVITLVFVISIAALLYWAVNVATASLTRRTTRQEQALSPRNTITEALAALGSGSLAKLNGSIRVCWVS